MHKFYTKNSLFILFLLLPTQNSWGGELDIDLAGLSYHIGANSQKPAYESAPLGLDNNGAFWGGGYQAKAAHLAAPTRSQQNALETLTPKSGCLPPFLCTGTVSFLR